MEWKYIRPIEDLHKLKFLSEIRTEEEYNEKCRGPYLVGYVTDRERFTDAIMKAYRKLLMNLRHWMRI